MDNKSFDTQIEALRHKISTNEKYIGYDLVDSFSDSSFLNYVISKADQNFYDYILKKSSSYDSALIVLALTIVGLKDYDGAYWSHVEDRFYYCYVESERSSGFVNEKFRGAIRKHFIHSDSDNRLINYVLKQAVMPVEYLHNYFELMFDIYKKNFYYYLGSTSEIEDELKMAFNGISNTGTTIEEDEFKSDVTNKVYVLIKSTREVMKEKQGVEALIHLSCDVLKIIDAYYNSVECDLLDNAYYKIGFDNWIKYHVNKKELRKEGNSDDTNKRTVYNQTPYFELIDDEVYLTVPARKISSDHDTNDLSLRIINGDEVLCESKNFIIEKQIGVNIVKPKERIKIDSPIGQLRYEFICNETVIYSSLNKLFRNYIAFDDKSNEIKNTKAIKGIIRVVSKDFNSQSLQIIRKYENYCVGIVNIDEDGYFYLFNELVNITGNLSSGIVGEKYENTYLLYSEEVVPVYSKVDKLIIETKLNSEDVILIINGKDYPLTDFHYSIKKSRDQSSYIISLDLLDGVLYFINAINRIDESVIGDDYLFLIDKNLNYNYQDGVLTYTSSIAESCEHRVDINDYKTFSPLVTISDEEGDNYSYNYFFPYGINVIKFDNGRWEPVDELWGADIKPHSHLFTYGIFCDQVVVYDCENNKLGSLPVKNIFTGVSIDCTFLYSLKKKHVVVKLKFNKNGSTKATVDCYFSCVIDEKKSVFKYDEVRNALMMNVSYHGKGKLLVSINKEANVAINYSNQFIAIPNITLFKPVNIAITELRLGQTNKPIFEKKVSFISLNKLDGHIYEINKLMYEEFCRNKRFTREVYAQRTFLYIKQKVSDNLYYGELFTGSISNKRLLNKINPVKIEVISDELFEEKMFSVGITTLDDDGLFLNKSYSTILNSDYSKEAPDIVTYELMYVGNIW